MKNPFRRQEILPEVFLAHLHSLPEDIRVTWKKEDDLIVGRIEFNKFSFATQGRDVNEFIDMVNEGVLVAHDTPREYMSLLRQVRTYLPPRDELEALAGDDRGVAHLPRNEEAEHLVLA